MVDVNNESAQNLLAALRASHIAYSRDDQVVLSAQVACKLIENGRSGPDVVGVIRDKNPGLPEADAAKFLALAEQTYCPPQPAAPPGEPAPPPSETDGS